MSQDEWFLRLKVRGIRWEKDGVERQYYAVDYSGEVFKPRLLRLRIPVETDHGPMSWVQIYWVEGYENDFRSTLEECSEFIQKSGCRTERLSLGDAFKRMQKTHPL